MKFNSRVIAMKKILSLFIVVLMSLSLCGCSNSQKVNVSVEIDCSEILKNYDDLDESLKDEKYVPSDGVILKEASFEVTEGASATEILEQVSKKCDIPIDVSDGYAKSINHLSEKSCGPMSGWVYEVNNEMVMDEYHASEGDLITWKFICSFD